MSFIRKNIDSISVLLAHLIGMLRKLSVPNVIFLQAPEFNG